MIDREAREKAAEVVRHFISGKMTNFDFENEMPSSKDPVIWAIESSLWCFYDDFTKHKMSGDWALPKETKAIMARWVMFLHTNEEYFWPKLSYPGVLPIKYGFIGKLLNKEKSQIHFMAQGSYEFWPFINSESYQNAKQNPVLLAGS